MPPLHVWFTQATGAPQVPLALHVSTPLPTQATAPGVHCTHVLLKQTGVEPEQVLAVCQLPFTSQD
jgi:hypothetical protein